MSPRPPLLARWLLRARLLGARRAEVEADLHELFVERAAAGGRGRAMLLYYGDVLSLWAWNVSGTRLANDALRDLSHGVRVFRRNPGAVAITVLGLALAIAVSTSVFTFVNATILRKTGVSDPDSAVRVMRAHKGGISTVWRYGEYLALRDGAPRMPIEGALRDSARFSASPGSDADRDPQIVQMTFVGEGYLRVFGAPVVHGRILSRSDDSIGAPAVVIVSYGFWMRRLAGDPAIVGRQVWLNGVPATVVGITARSFTGISDQPPAFWAPFASYHVLYSGSPITRASQIDVNLYGRVPAGSTRMQAETELGALAVAAISSSTGANPINGVRLDLAASRFSGSKAGPLVLVVTIVLTVVGLTVLLACVNVANLQLASALARRREIGVRLALGAAPGRLVRQLVTESLALGLVAGAIGLLLTAWLVPTLARLVRLPVTVDTAPDLRVYTFLAVVSIAAGVGAGLAPARHGTRGDLLTPLKEGGSSGAASSPPNRLREVLIGVQAAASLVLLVLAALLTRATVRAVQIDIGFDGQHLVAVAPAFGRERYNGEQTRRYWNVALERVRGISGVRGAALGAYLPFGGGHSVTSFEYRGVDYRTYLQETDADYFSTLGLRTIRGRIYTAIEVAARAPVAVISETLARDFWPGEDPVGQSLDRFDGTTSITVIGIVSDAITGRLRESSSAAIYRPIAGVQAARILVRTSGPPEAAVPALRDALQPIDPRVRLDISLVSNGLQQELDEPRMLATLAGSLAALALGLSIVGIYGVTTFVTGQRTREVGLRIAIGASRRDVLRLLLVDSLRPVMIGLAAGAVLALLASRLFAGVLYGVGAHDPIAFAGAAGILLLSAAVAVFVPARRASHVDPAFVLRQC